MSLPSVIVKKLAALFLGIIAVVRRMLCFLHIVRRRKNSGSLLPMTNDQTSLLVQDGGHPMQSLPSNDYEELEAWDAWGANDVSGFGQSLGTNQNHVGNHSNAHHRTSSKSEEELEPEPDFFQDMVPEVKRTAKILIRKKEDPHPGTMSSRLAMSATIPTVPPGSELGQWDESESAWSQEATEDLSDQALDALKVSKYQERIRRQAEQQQKKLLKEHERKQRRDTQFSAVKLS